MPATDSHLDLDHRDAPTVGAKRPKRWDQPFSSAMDSDKVQEVLKYEPFCSFKAELPRVRLQKLEDLIRYDCALRECTDGEILIRQGDYGTSAFIILDGTVQFLTTPVDPSLLGRRDVPRKGRWQSALQILRLLFRKNRGPECRNVEKFPQFQNAKRRRDVIDSALPGEPPGITPEEILKKCDSDGDLFTSVQDLKNDLKAGEVSGQWAVGQDAADDGAPRWYRANDAGRVTKPRVPVPVDEEAERQVLDGYPAGFGYADSQSADGTTYTTDCYFGEIGALARIERQVTVVTGDGAGGCGEKTHLLLEARWQGFRDLMKLVPKMDRDVKERYQANCKKSVLQSSIFKFVQLDDAAQKRIRDKSTVTLYGDFEWAGKFETYAAKDSRERLESEPVIACEGENLEGVFCLMSGFGRISERHGNGERTIRYIGPKSGEDWANIVGLSEAFHNWSIAEGDEPIALQHSLRAVGYALTVFIPSSVLEKYVFPKLSADKRPPPPEDKSRRAVVAKERTSGRSRDRDRTGLVEFLLESRVMNGRQTMVIDLDRCTRCDDCVRACAATHDDNPRFVRHGLQYEQYMIANACMHCADPVCMIGCPTGAIHRMRDGWEIVINDLTCIGCGVCATNCPYDNIRNVPIRDLEGRPVKDANGKVWVKATKCDLCVDQGGGPACQNACPHDALIRIDTSKIGVVDAWIDR